MTKISTMFGLIAAAAVGSVPVSAQTVADSETPATNLAIPGNVQLYGDGKPNVYRPSAIVNGEVITATDIEQRMALIRIANNDTALPPEELQRLRQQVFSNLIDEKLQIQEARAAKIDIDENLIDEQFAPPCRAFQTDARRIQQIPRLQRLVGRRGKAANPRRIRLGPPAVAQHSVDDQRIDR